MAYLARRMHSRSELKRKLQKGEFPDAEIEQTLDRLTELHYLDDAEFARQKLAQTQRKLIGQRRAMQELLKSGVKGETARSAVREHFDRDESRENAQHLIDKNLPRLQRLEPLVAKRRLVGLLMRRGFEYEAVKPLVERALGSVED
jgi:regulatory protein